MNKLFNLRRTDEICYHTSSSAEGTKKLAKSWIRVAGSCVMSHPSPESNTKSYIVHYKPSNTRWASVLRKVTKPAKASGAFYNLAGIHTCGMTGVNIGLPRKEFAFVISQKYVKSQPAQKGRITPLPERDRYIKGYWPGQLATESSTVPFELSDQLTEEYHELIDKQLGQRLTPADSARMNEISALMAEADAWELEQISSRQNAVEETAEMRELRKLNQQVTALLEALGKVGNHQKEARTANF